MTVEQENNQNYEVIDKSISEVYRRLREINSESIRQGEGTQFGRYKQLLDKVYNLTDNIYSKINLLLILSMDSNFYSSDYNEDDIEKLKEEVITFYKDIILKRFGQSEILEYSNAIIYDEDDKLTTDDLRIAMVKDMTYSYKFQYKDDEKMVYITDDLKVYFKEFSDEDKVIALIPVKISETQTQLDIAVLDTNRLSHISTDVVDTVYKTIDNEMNKRKILELSKMNEDGTPKYKLIKNVDENDLLLREEVRVSEENMDVFLEELNTQKDAVIKKWEDENGADIYLFNISLNM